MFDGNKQYLGSFCLLGINNSLVYFVCCKKTIPWYILFVVKWPYLDMFCFELSMKFICLGKTMQCYILFAGERLYLSILCLMGFENRPYLCNFFFAWRNIPYLGIFCLLGIDHTLVYFVSWEKPYLSILNFLGKYLGIFYLWGKDNILIYFVCWENTIPWYILFAGKIKNTLVYFG